jgi:hypothetical protein
MPAPSSTSFFFLRHPGQTNKREKNSIREKRCGFYSYSFDFLGSPSTRPVTKGERVVGDFHSGFLFLTHKHTHTKKKERENDGVPLFVIFALHHQVRQRVTQQRSTYHRHRCLPYKKAATLLLLLHCQALTYLVRLSFFLFFFAFSFRAFFCLSGCFFFFLRQLPTFLILPSLPLAVVCHIGFEADSLRRVCPLLPH